MIRMVGSREGADEELTTHFSLPFVSLSLSVSLHDCL